METEVYSLQNYIYNCGTSNQTFSNFVPNIRRTKYSAFSNIHCPVCGLSVYDNKLLINSTTEAENSAIQRRVLDKNSLCSIRALSQVSYVCITYVINKFIFNFFCVWLSNYMLLVIRFSQLFVKLHPYSCSG